MASTSQFGSSSSSSAPFGIELTILGAAAAALASTGHEALAIAFAALAVLSGTLNYRWSS